MKYFFTLAYNGVNKNGNSTYKVTGFKEVGNGTKEFIPLDKVTMQEFVGGRWSDRTESITAQKSVLQILEKIKENTKDYSYGIVKA